MVFSSFEFIFTFLPIVLAGTYLVQRRGDLPVKIWLILASLVFYAAWYPPYLLILGGSIAANYCILQLALSRPEEANRSRFWIVTAGVTANVCLLGLFKYEGFFASNVNELFHSQIVVATFLLPLGISFITFQKIALLVDVYRRDVKEISLPNYLMFVTFFPQLIAGPIVLFPEVQHQYTEHGHVRVSPARLALGLSVFAVGLFKKVMLADLMATYATPVFSAVAQGQLVRSAEAWAGVIGYTLQIYFDFSGYSDMAVGLAAMFGIVLPFNFASPYRALSVIEFWRRWHITLSRFLRVYLYIPLGGNRRGPIRRYANLMIVMLIGGLWHGAAWTFVAWGALHGAYLVINHLWRSWAPSLPASRSFVRLLGRIAAWFITFLAVIVAWVFFRADSFAAAAAILSKMFQPSGWLEILSSGFPRDGLFVAVAFYQTNDITTAYIPWVLTIGLAICLVMPNTQAFFEAWLEMDRDEVTKPLSSIAWRPSKVWGTLVGAMFAAALMGMSRGSSPFLYFNF